MKLCRYKIPEHSTATANTLVAMGLVVITSSPSHPIATLITLFATASFVNIPMYVAALIRDWCMSRCVNMWLRLVLCDVFTSLWSVCNNPRWRLRTVIILIPAFIAKVASMIVALLIPCFVFASCCHPVFVDNTLSRSSQCSHRGNFGFFVAINDNVCKRYGCRTFYHAGPTVWRSLPDKHRNFDSFDGFKWFLKTILFSHY